MRKPLLLLLLVTTASAASLGRYDEDQMPDNEDANPEPMILPILSDREKIQLAAESEQHSHLRSRHRIRRGRKHNKRDLLLAPWRVSHVVRPRPILKPVAKPAIALPIDTCPNKFDAVTRGYNGRTYVFARDRVYQVWHDDGLQQKASYLISDLFPGGPRTVTAALTNSRSGVTILMEHRTAYRFRWNKKHKRFQLAKNTPQELPRNVTITPKVAFEWTDGNQVALDKEHFIIYDAFWNLATFTGHTRKYFPNLPRDLLGIVYNGGDTVLMFTKSNSLKVYNTKKFKVVQEYPLKLNEYVGCLTPSTEKPTGRSKSKKP